MLYIVVGQLEEIKEVPNPIRRLPPKNVKSVTIIHGRRQLRKTVTQILRQLKTEVGDGGWMGMIGGWG